MASVLLVIFGKEEAPGILMPASGYCGNVIGYQLKKTIVKMTIEKINNSALLHMFLFLFLSTQLSAQGISNLSPGTHQTIKSEVHINNKSGGTITKNELLESSGLSLTSAYDSIFQISSFIMTRIRQGELPVEESNHSNGQLNEAMKSILNNSRKGDKIYFEYIKCKANDGTIRSMSALSFLIE